MTLSVGHHSDPSSIQPPIEDTCCTCAPTLYLTFVPAVAPLCPPPFLPSPLTSLLPSLLSLPSQGLASQVLREVHGTSGLTHSSGSHQGPTNSRAGTQAAAHLRPPASPCFMSTIEVCVCVSVPALKTGRDGEGGHGYTLGVFFSVSLTRAPHHR